MRGCGKLWVLLGELGGSGGALGGSIYRQTPDQPHQRTLCYYYRQAQVVLTIRPCHRKPLRAGWVGGWGRGWLAAGGGVVGGGGGAVF